MIKAGVGISKSQNTAEAAQEACKEALDKAGSAANLIIVFSSVAHNQEEVVKGVRAVSKDIPLVGCSDAGEITTQGSTIGKIAVMALNMDRVQCSLGCGIGADKDSFVSGKQAAEAVKSATEVPPSLFMMLGEGLAENGAAALRGVQSVMGKNFPIMGGSAGDDFKFEKTYQYINDKVLNNSVVGVGLSGDFVFGVGVRHGWEPVGPTMKVTKSEGAKLIEVDGRPALSIYEDYFGKRAEELIKEPIAKMAYTYPLGMSVEASSELLLVNVVIANKKGEITCAAEILEGVEIRLMLGDAEKAIEAARKAAEDAKKQLQGSQPKAVIVFDCMARWKLLGSRRGEEITAIQEVLGKDVPLIGFYTYGEQAPLGGALGDNCYSRFHNETIALMVIGE